MITVVDGSIEVLGAHKITPGGGGDYEFIRFATRSSEDLFVKAAIVPGELNSYLMPGVSGRFVFAEFFKFDGGKRSLLCGMQVNGKVVKLNDLDTMAAKDKRDGYILLTFGILTVPLIFVVLPIGPLMIYCGTKLLKNKLPKLSEVQSALEATTQIPH